MDNPEVTIIKENLKAWRKVLMDRHNMPETYKEYREVMDTIKDYCTRMVFKKLIRDYENICKEFDNLVVRHSKKIVAETMERIPQERKPDDINVHNGVGYKGD